jgi:hypothetical protein
MLENLQELKWIYEVDPKSRTVFLMS